MIRRTYNRDPVYSLLLTFGLAFVLEDGARYIWGRERFADGIAGRFGATNHLDLFFITWYRVFMVAIVIVTVIGLFAFLRYSRVGLRIRAGTFDLETVATLGVNVRHVRTLNFAVGVFLAGLSGVLAAGQIGLKPTMGDRPADAELHRHHRGRRRQLDRHAVWRPPDWVASRVTAVFLPAASEAVIYVSHAVVLLIRPRGLLGEEGMLT